MQAATIDRVCTDLDPQIRVAAAGGRAVGERTEVQDDLGFLRHSGYGQHGTKTTAHACTCDASAVPYKVVVHARYNPGPARVRGQSNAV